MKNNNGIITFTWSIKNFFERAEELKSIKNYKLDTKKWHCVGTIEPTEIVASFNFDKTPKSSARIIFSYFTSPEFKVYKEDKHTFKLYLYPQGLMRGKNGEITDNMAIVLQLNSDPFNEQDSDKAVMLRWRPDLYLKNIEHKKFYDKIINNDWSKEILISDQVQKRTRRTNFVDFNQLKKHFYSEKSLIFKIEIEIVNTKHPDLKISFNNNDDDEFKNETFEKQKVEEQIVDYNDQDYILAYYNVQFHKLVTNNFPFNEAKHYEKLFKNFFSIKLNQHQNVFVYFLIDPRNLNNNQNTDNEFQSLIENNALKVNFSMLTSFIRSIFYIGKGQNGRPFDHFKNYYLDDEKVSIKKTQIKEIYKSGLSPMVLFAFCGLSNDEAITRESLLIESLIDQLTNKKLEKCRMVLSKRQRDVLSAYFVFKAFIMFQIDGGTAVKMISNKKESETDD